MRTRLILGIISYLATSSFVLAQTATGVIRGSVQDRTGAALIDAHVELRDEARNQGWEQTTNEEGFFEFRALPFGNYTVKVEHPHFIKQVIENIALQVGQTENLRITLEVGAENASIVVHADGGLLELRTRACLKSSTISGSWDCRLTDVM
jgi:Carboxypeptidase regulatory-like domain